MPFSPGQMVRHSAMLQLSADGTYRLPMPAGKRPRGAHPGQRSPISPEGVSVIVVAAVRPKAATTTGTIGGMGIKVMLDS